MQIQNGKQIFKSVLLNRAPTFTQLHRSTHLYPAHISLHPDLCNNLKLYEPKHPTILDNFPKFRQKKSKLSVLPKNWQTYTMKILILNPIPNPELRFSKFRPQNPFLGKFGPKKSKLSVLPDFCSDISFLKFQT